jgi:hypothetical protein
MNYQLLNKENIMKVNIDVRQGEGENNGSVYVTIGDWVVYLDNSTGEQIINSYTKKEEEEV